MTGTSTERKSEYRFRYDGIEEFRRRNRGYLVNNPNARYIAAPKGTLPNGGRNTVQLRPIDDIDIASSSDQG